MLEKQTTRQVQQTYLQHKVRGEHTQTKKKKKKKKEKIKMTQRRLPNWMLTKEMRPKTLKCRRKVGEKYWRIELNC